MRLLIGLLFVVSSIGAACGQSPPPPDRVITRVAFGSCANQEREQPIWAAISAYRPELFLFAGDNVYADVLDGKSVPDDGTILSSMATAYARAAAIPGLKALRESVPHLAVWDDHDYGRNDGGADFVHRDAAQKLFVDFWRLPPDDPRRSRAGLYHALTVGPAGKRLQIILLDTRYFRSPLRPAKAGTRRRYDPDDAPDKTILGEEQWSWLEARLREPADVRLIVSSIQVVADGHGWERWGNLPRERQRLYDLIARTGASRVVLLSGDRHIGAIYRETRRVPYPIWDFTSSGLTHAYAGADEPGPNRVGALFGAVNFGTIEIDWWASTLTLSIRALNGEAVRRQVLPLAALEARKARR
jgi:alkaline phosphatase D